MIRRLKPRAVETRTDKSVDELALEVRKVCGGCGFSLLYLAEGFAPEPLIMIEWRSMIGIKVGRVRTSAYARTLGEAFSVVLEYEQRAVEFGEEATAAWHFKNKKVFEQKM